MASPQHRQTPRDPQDPYSLLEHCLSADRPRLRRDLRRADHPALAAAHADGEVLPGLWAVGEVAGFGGGGVHGERALEGTFLGGCLFSGRTVGEAIG